MERLLVYHNPACSQSRKALETLRAGGAELEIVEYLKTPLDREALASLVDRIGAPAANLVRKDKRFTALGLREEDYQSKETVVALLAKHPELMQRPVIVRGSRAMIARPGERATEILRAGP